MSKSRFIIVLTKRRLAPWLVFVGIVVCAMALGYVTSTVQKRFYREDFTFLHVATWGALLASILLRWAESPRKRPAATLPIEQQRLQARLAALSPRARQCFAVSCCQRLNGYERDVGEPEEAEVVEFRQKTLAAMWGALLTGSDFPARVHLEKCQSFVPDADACPGCFVRSVDTCKMIPILEALERWPNDSVGDCFQIAVHTRDFLDQIVMDELAEGKFDPGAEMARRIVGGVAWNSEEGLASHPVMRREVELEYADLELLQRSEPDAATIEVLKQRSSTVR